MFYTAVCSCHYLGNDDMGTSTVTGYFRSERLKNCKNLSKGKVTNREKDIQYKVSICDIWSDATQRHLYDETEKGTKISLMWSGTIEKDILFPSDYIVKLPANSSMRSWWELFVWWSTCSLIRGEISTMRASVRATIDAKQSTRTFKNSNTRSLCREGQSRQRETLATSTRVSEILHSGTKCKEIEIETMKT